MRGTFRVLLADDHPLVLAGMRMLFERIEAEANNGREAVALAGEHRPDLVVMDISMTDLNGIDATAFIRRVMMLSPPPQSRQFLALSAASHGLVDVDR